jgi:hypothetical protein
MRAGDRARNRFCECSQSGQESQARTHIKTWKLSTSQARTQIRTGTLSRQARTHNCKMTAMYGVALVMEGSHLALVVSRGSFFGGASIWFVRVGRAGCGNCASRVWGREATGSVCWARALHTACCGRDSATKRQTIVRERRVNRRNGTSVCGGRRGRGRPRISSWLHTGAAVARAFECGCGGRERIPRQWLGGWEEVLEQDIVLELESEIGAAGCLEECRKFAIVLGQVNCFRRF